MAGKKNTPEKFWSKVQRREPHECWEWQASTDRHGYGQIAMDGKTWRSHRLAWALTNGAIGQHKCVLHRCDNRKCCNPNHLFLGTPADNAFDRDTKMRHVYGERSPNAKVTENDVREIRRRLSEGEFQTNLAREYGIGNTTMNRIARRLAWAHVEEEQTA